MSIDTMLDKLLQHLSFSNGNGLHSILILLIVFFFIVTLSLFIYAIIQRIKNKVIAMQDIRFKKNWDKVILQVMNNDIHPFDAYKKLKKRNSIRYLFYLEEFIDLLKGKEKDRLLTLGRLSLKNVYRYLRSKDHEKIIYGIHLIGIFHPEEQYKFLMLKPGDMNMTLIAIREMHAVEDIGIIEQLIKLLFKLPNISYIYISNLLVEMGPGIIPFLHQVIETRFDFPNEQMIAIETIRRMHHMGALDLSGEVLTKATDPGVLACWLRYLEDQRDDTQLNLIIPYMDHPHAQVRTAAIRAYLELCDDLSADNILKIFNDPDIMIPINAAEIMENSKMFPYLSTGSIENLKWKDIYKEILV
jgi:hypothetical protein